MAVQLGASSFQCKYLFYHVSTEVFKGKFLFAAELMVALVHQARCCDCLECIRRDSHATKMCQSHGGKKQIQTQCLEVIHNMFQLLSLATLPPCRILEWFIGDCFKALRKVLVISTLFGA